MPNQKDKPEPLSGGHAFGLLKGRKKETQKCRKLTLSTSFSWTDRSHEKCENVKILVLTTWYKFVVARPRPPNGPSVLQLRRRRNISFWVQNRYRVSINIPKLFEFFQSNKRFPSYSQSRIWWNRICYKGIWHNWNCCGRIWYNLWMQGILNGRIWYERICYSRI